MSLITGAAHASDVAWYVGRTVDEVRIEAVDGQSLEADMTPILRLQPGGPLDSGDMRSDVALLVRGGFAAVEAMVEETSEA